MPGLLSGDWGMAVDFAVYRLLRCAPQVTVVVVERPLEFVDAVSEGLRRCAPEESATFQMSSGWIRQSDGVEPGRNQLFAYSARMVEGNYEKFRGFIEEDVMFIAQGVSDRLRDLFFGMAEWEGYCVMELSVTQKEG